MDQFRRQFLMAAFKLLDVLIMIAVFLLSSAIVYLQTNSISFQEFFHIRVKIENFALFLGLLFIWHLIFSTSGLYRSKRFSSLKAEIIDLFKATTFGTVVIFLAAWIFKIDMITPLFLLAFWAGTCIATITIRIMLRVALKWIRIHGRNIRYLVIVGTNERARKFAKNIEARPQMGYRLIGFVDEKWEGKQTLTPLYYLYIT